MRQRLHVITVSTRPGRIGDKVAQWFCEAAAKDETFEIVPVDLNDFDLPVYDEPKHPATGEYAHEHTRAWAKSVSEADAYVFVMPEYNFTMPPSLVNALNYVYREWNYKPAGILSYGGVSGGLRAAQSAKLLLTTLKVMPMYEAVVVPFVHNQIKDSRFTPNETQEKAVPALLRELAIWSTALKGARDRIKG